MQNIMPFSSGQDVKEWLENKEYYLQPNVVRMYPRRCSTLNCFGRPQKPFTKCWHCNKREGTRV